MPDRPRIEVVGADEALARELAGDLAAAGYDAHDGGGRPALTIAAGAEPAERCRGARAAEARAGVPILALLPEGAGPGAATACLDAGADDVLARPAEVPALAARVGALLGAASAKGRARSLEDTRRAVLAVKAGVSEAGSEPTPEELATAAAVLDTKDFLERLIDSTVDGIIAADMKGRVILFNAGAERIYGYSGEEVVGKTPVWDLYPEGVARRLMRMLRSSSHGGPGRLEQTRWEVRAKDGEIVPVNLSASLIYEGHREVASVGVFSDLRDRLRMEKRLADAQHKLERREKQAVVAELAGAAAHELNQPLTSIMGYTALIRRQSGPDAAHLRALGVIEEETSRMAEIVKKIGRITRFETKTYVGDASILDLERSAGAGEPGGAGKSTDDDGDGRGGGSHRAE